MLSEEKLNRLRVGDYEFRFGRYLDDGLALVHQNLGIALLFPIVLLGLNIVLGLFGNPGNLVYNFLISPIMQAGFYVFCHHVRHRKQPDVQDYFSQFHRWREVMVIGVAQSLLFVTAFVVLLQLSDLNWNEPFIITELGRLELNASELTNTTLLVFGLLIALGLVASALLSFALPLVVFHDLSGLEAVSLSFAILNSKTIYITVFLVVVGVLMVMGVFGFIIGLLYTIPVGYAMHYAAFDDIVGSETEAEDITKHMIL